MENNFQNQLRSKKFKFKWWYLILVYLLLAGLIMLAEQIVAVWLL